MHFEIVPHGKTWVIRWMLNKYVALDEWTLREKDMFALSLALERSGF